MATRRAGSTRAAARTQLTAIDGLAQVAFLIHGMLERLAAEHDVSMIQTRLLGVLRDRKPTMNQLAKLLELDKSSASGLVDRAERRGLVVRVPSPTDRRAVVVGLTARGRSLVRQVAARFETEVSELLDLLGPRDRATLSGLVSQLLIAHAGEHGIDLSTELEERRHLP